MAESRELSHSFVGLPALFGIDGEVLGGAREGCQNVGLVGP